MTLVCRQIGTADLFHVVEKTVTLALEGLDETAGFLVIPERLANAGDGLIEIVCLNIDIRPHVFDQGLLGQGVATIAHQHGQRIQRPMADLYRLSCRIRQALVLNIQAEPAK